ncbi:MAG: DUF4393 domain-containing protein [Pseudonocardiaceae bacterium]|nr:DUF4393 domain-containing protein [Pseudonocardiaceae bacterium]
MVLPVGDLAVGVQRAVRWVARSGWGLGQRLPGIGLVERELRRVERGAQRIGRTAAHQLARRMAAVNRNLAESDPAKHAMPDGQADSLRAGMAELLNRAVDSSAAASRHYLYASILARLVPDEARILAALSDGPAFPVIDVATRGAMGGTNRVVLRNASTVGKSAGVTLNDSVPTYVARLLDLGLVELGDEDSSLDMEYDVLLTDALVQDADRRARAAGRLAPRMIRRSLRISELGKDFWTACDPSDPSAADQP